MKRLIAFATLGVAVGTVAVVHGQMVRRTETIDAVARSSMADGSNSAGIRQGANRNQKSSVLGNGQGLAEVIVLVRDLEAALDVYRDRLGFTLPRSIDTLPSGLKLIGAKFERNNYLELRSIADREKATRLRPRIMQFLEKHEGAFQIVVAVASTKSTAGYLRTRGFKVNEESFPEFSVVSFEGTYELSTNALPPGITEASPTRALAFAQFISPAETPSDNTKLEKERTHPNTAKGIQSVWIAVRDLKTATNAYESVGLHANRERNLPELGATGREVEVGQGVILLVQPQKNDGKVASFLADRGEGIMGVSMEVRDLTTARQLLEASTKRNFIPYAGSYGTSLLIPAEMTGGLWIEMFERTEK